MIKPTWYRIVTRDERGKEVVELRATREAATAHVRVRILETINDLLVDHSNLAFARDHSFVIRAIGGIGDGLAIDSRCENRPCPWLGDGPDDYEPRTGSKTIFSANMILDKEVSR